MKAFLLHEALDFDPHADLPPNADDLIKDLELNRMFAAMAAGDKFIFEVARQVVLTSLTDAAAIVYRQHVLSDCLEHSSIVREMYAIAIEAIEGEGGRSWYSFGRYPAGTLHTATSKLGWFVASLKKLRRVADDQGPQFRSEGFLRLFKMLRQELDDEYFRVIQAHMRRLRFPRGVLISAELGKGNKGIHYHLRRPYSDKQPWLQQILDRFRRPPYSFEIDPRDEAGARALSELNDRGLNLAANALAQSTDHIQSFFTMLRTELAFYLGCLNLHDQLVKLGQPTCTPIPKASDNGALSARGLYDVCLALRMKSTVVGNELDGDNRNLVMITGANQGGKSTFLRGLGLAQLMTQCGMFVPAQRFTAGVRASIFTHYRREEDVTMKSGKLDEELSRMSKIADLIVPNSLLLCNESFSSTNEREGSQIARQIIRALLESGVKVFFVTHLYDLAQGFHSQMMDDALFLRAERLRDGQRTFKVTEGEPLPTSYGEDLYAQVFGPAGDAA
jgi:hypothetical protein